MTSTLCQSAALDRIIAPWTAKIAEFLHILVKTILTIAEMVRTTLREFGACCRKAGQRLLSWPMMPKLGTTGRYARLLRHGTGFLSPSASALHAAIGAAPARITDNRKVDPDVSLSARMREARQASSPQVLLDRSQEEQPAEGKLMDPEAHDTGSERQTCPHVKRSCGSVIPLSATEH